MKRGEKKMSETKDGIKLKSVYEILKFKGDYRSLAEALQHEQPFAHETFSQNVALNEGINEAWDLICGTGSPTAYSNANARVGVGDGTAGANASQTGLQGTNKAFVGMDTGYPTTDNQQAVFQGTFGDAQANFAWEEYTVVNAADDTGKNLVRKVENHGTKNGGTWVLKITLTMS
ncbi:hypothetical protein KEJ39_03930 [Candidatus Bathyarchaeota archaeon]|nr:hypothetical protein [Candidatus Bathyarchaeota archaeon]